MALRIKHFDFRRARIRISKDGKIWRIADKCSVIRLLQDINYYKYCYADVVFTYDQCKKLLLTELKSLKDQTVEIELITNEEQ